MALVTMLMPWSRLNTVSVKRQAVGCGVVVFVRAGSNDLNMTTASSDLAPLPGCYGECSIGIILPSHDPDMTARGVAVIPPVK